MCIEILYYGIIRVIRRMLMNPEIFSIGNISIRWYSVLILAGMIIAILLAEKEAKVIFGGRLGEYKYYDMDAVIASALERRKKELGS